LISLYEKAPKQFQERESVQPSDIDPRARGLVQGDLTKPGERGQMDFVLTALKQRKAELEAFMKAPVVPFVPPTKLLQEMDKATMQYGLSRSENAKKWFITMFKLHQDSGKILGDAYKKRDEAQSKMVERSLAYNAELKRRAAAGDREAQRILSAPQVRLI
jgi:hypothetical protein